MSLPRSLGILLAQTAQPALTSGPAPTAPAAADLSGYQISAVGWVFMLVSIAFVLALISFCFYRVLRKPSAAEHMHAPIEIDTRDRET